MRKVVFGLALIFACAAFVGCGPSSPPNDPPLKPQDSGADKDAKKGKAPLDPVKEKE